MDNYKLISAFTFVELLVVMAITAILGSLGIAGMTVLRQNTQFQQVQVDVITSLTTVNNQARNSVASIGLSGGGTSLPNSVVDAYALGISANNYSIYRCSVSTSGVNPQANCSQAERQNIKPATLGDVGVYFTNATKCRALMFERLTSNIYSLNNLIGVPDNTGTCTIHIQHSQNANLRRDIVIDLVKNTIDVV